MRKFLLMLIMTCGMLLSIGQVTLNVNGTNIQVQPNSSGQNYSAIAPTTSTVPVPEKYNVIFIADGFSGSLQSQQIFNGAAADAVAGILAKEPYLSNSSKFNFYRINVISVPNAKVGVAVTIPSGQTITTPRRSISPRAGTTALNTYYGSNPSTFKMVFSTTPQLIHDLADAVFPDNHAIVVISNTDGEIRVRGLCVYGIIFLGLNSAFPEDITLIPSHEIAHHVGRLADEYVDPLGSGTYSGCEPTNVNVTKCARVSLCAPVDNTGGCNYDWTAKRTNWDTLMNHADGVLGAGFHANGLYRPQQDCYMRDFYTTPDQQFCSVCSKELINNFCPTPKPPRITTDAIPGPKYIEMLKGESAHFRNATGVTSQTELVELDISPNYLTEITYDSAECGIMVTFTATGVPGVLDKYNWYRVHRNSVGLVTYLPLLSNVPDHPEQYRTEVSDTIEIACTQTINNCVSDYRVKRVVPRRNWYLDADDDGYVTGPPLAGCTSPGPKYKYEGINGYTDCNDDNIAIHPGATEVCDGIDNNCVNGKDEGIVPVTPTRIISSAGTSFCLGNSTTLSVQGGSLGTAAAWKWTSCLTTGSSGTCSGAETDITPDGDQITVSPTLVNTLYKVSATACNRTVGISIIIHTNPIPASELNYPGSKTICVGSSLFLNTLEEPPIDASYVTRYVYRWQGPGLDKTVPNGSDRNDVPLIIHHVDQLKAGHYTLTVTNSSGCSSTSSVDVNIIPGISNNSISADHTICSGQNGHELIGSLPAGSDGSFVYAWEKSITSGTAGFSPATGTANAQNYSPGPLNQNTWFRRNVTSVICGGSVLNISNVIKVTVIDGPVGTPSTIVGPTEVCTRTSISHYTTSAANALSYSWEITPPNTISGTGTEAVVTWNNSSSEIGISVKANGCNGSSNARGLKVFRNFCTPTVTINCRLSGPSRMLCNTSLEEICNSLTGECTTGHCSTKICDAIQNWGLRIEGMSMFMRVELIAASGPDKKGRVLASEIYRNKSIAIPMPKTLKLKNNETLWLRFVQLDKRKTKDIKIVFSKGSK